MKEMKKEIVSKDKVGVNINYENKIVEPVGLGNRFYP